MPGKQPRVNECPVITTNQYILDSHIAPEAQLEAMQNSKERDSEGNAKALSNPTTLARDAAPSANAGAAFSSVAEHEEACSSGDFERQEAPRHARAAISSGRWLRNAAEISSAKHALCGVFECCRRG